MHSRVNTTLLSRPVRDNYDEATRPRRLDRDVTGTLRNIVFLNVANIAYVQSCELRNMEIERISAKLKSRKEVCTSESPNARQLNPLHHSRCNSMRARARARVRAHVFPVRDLNIVLSACCGVTLSPTVAIFIQSNRIRVNDRTCRMIFNNAGHWKFNYSVVYSRIRSISEKSSEN